MKCLHLTYECIHITNGTNRIKHITGNKMTMTNGQSRDSGNLGHETQKQRQTKQKDDLYVV